MDAPDELLCELDVRFDGLKEQVVGADSQVVGDLRSQVTCRSIRYLKLVRVFFGKTEIFLKKMTKSNLPQAL